MPDVTVSILSGKFCCAFLFEDDSSDPIACPFYQENEAGSWCANPNITHNDLEEGLELDDSGTWTGNIFKPQECIDKYGE